MSKKREKIKKDDLESRFRKLEVHLAYLSGAATVLVTAVLAFLGAANWYTIPTIVNKQISTEVGEETIKKLTEAGKKADSILSASNLQEDVKRSIDESVSKLKEDVKRSIDESASNLQKDVKSIDKSVSKLQEEVRKINEALFCKNPVEECVCKLDGGSDKAKLIVCVSRCPGGRIRGIEIKEIVSTTSDVSCGNLKSKIFWE
jgi:SMC interacting uncharacterized protein involved in chromosome segregation